MTEPSNVVGFDAWRKKKAEEGPPTKPAEPQTTTALSRLIGTNGRINGTSAAERVFEVLVQTAEASENPDSNGLLPLLQECFRIEKIINNLGMPDVWSKIQHWRTTVKHYEKEDVLGFLVKAGDNDVRRKPYFYMALLHKAQGFVAKTTNTE